MSKHIVVLSTNQILNNWIWICLALVDKYWKKYYILTWLCKKLGHCIYILFYCFLNKLSSTMNGNKMYYNNPVTGRLSFEKFVIRRDFRKTNLHAEETHRGFSSHYIFSLGCFCTNKYNNATRSWKLLINWDWKPLSNSVWILSSLEIHLCVRIIVLYIVSTYIIKHLR